MPPLAAAVETGLTITNPLVLYRTLVATKKITPDPAQHRLALHLQTLYNRLKDYEPEVEYRVRLEEVTRALGRSTHGAAPLEPHRSGQKIAGDDGATSGGILSSLLSGWRGREAETTALTRRLSSHEAALHLDSPQGLLLYGEVGTGKSMLIDLLADALPNRKKRRYHFNAFMLDLFARIEQQRILRSGHYQAHGHVQSEHTLIAMARDMISTSPILFLDEFQLPDCAASKIISNLFTAFFQLGGVLIATSNRMPEELSKAAGVEFEAPSSPTARLGFSGLRNFSLFGASAKDDTRRGVTSRHNDFTQFLDVLKARCETWNMESKTDFRRRESESGLRKSRSQPRVVEHASQDSEAIMEQGTKAMEDASLKAADGVALPALYFQSTSDLLSPLSLSEESMWQASILQAVGTNHLSVADVPWQEQKLSVYGRKVGVPKACNGTSLWTFEQLCGSYLGPADYITLASTFHTLILTDVPVLHIVQKNEARRFITLLDALYESRCRLLIRADASPDDLFFPEQRHGTELSVPGGPKQEQEGDSVYAETLSEIYQDATGPFRPNVSTYGTNDRAESVSAEPHRATRSILADEDADFGPVYGAGRSAGASTYEHVEATQGKASGPNFQKTQTFTGQDERFAYKRAESRLWELCSQSWWERSANGELWKPLSREVRAWEHEASQADHVVPWPGHNELKDEANIFRHGASPFRVAEEAPPKLSWTHMWGLMKWGRKAGTWGQGTDGIDARAQEKQREKKMLEGVQRKDRRGADAAE